MQVFNERRISTDEHRIKPGVYEAKVPMVLYEDLDEAKHAKMNVQPTKLNRLSSPCGAWQEVHRRKNCRILAKFTTNTKI